VALLYLRHALTAVVTMAVLAVASALAKIIVGIVVVIAHQNNTLNQLNATSSSNCLSQGGTDPSC
jgi:hypothetical protein